MHHTKIGAALCPSYVHATLHDPLAASLHARRLVLVRADGHAAWRGDAMPSDPIAVIDRVRGA
jgi:hypothetical protein